MLLSTYTRNKLSFHPYSIVKEPPSLERAAGRAGLNPQGIPCVFSRPPAIFRFSMNTGSLKAKSEREVHSIKEVIQPEVPLRLPCYDFTPIIGPTVDGCLYC